MRFHSHGILAEEGRSVDTKFTLGPNARSTELKNGIALVRANPSSQKNRHFAALWKISERGIEKLKQRLRALDDPRRGRGKLFLRSGSVPTGGLFILESKKTPLETWRSTIGPVHAAPTGPYRIPEGPVESVALKNR
jgi:hypothetical protein